ncbi:hypothetical protein [Hymenobacter guriensis]|uniref:Uncharacterized protein n=1 Tax=Hymenobacter guriensis TaxID=2793065 RepID=A0ABS0L110_9BACT|nr:hypothetical protein [Hymenobacter guriensis]MBG8553758.1 hypothetical protein [Hymenobacter guriensis]
MKTKLFVAVMPLGLCACVYDPPQPSVQLINCSGQPATLELYFDTATYKSQWDKHQFRLFLTDNYGYSYPGPETKLVSSDTINLVQQYSIPVKSTFSISGWGDRNKPVLYRKMRIISRTDTVVYTDLEQLKKAFTRVSEFRNKLEIR